MLEDIAGAHDADIPEGRARDDAEALEARRVVQQQVEVGVGLQRQQRSFTGVLLEALDRHVWKHKHMDTFGKHFVMK